jgi:transmembrane sensor
MPTVDQHLLDKFFNGQCTEAERRVVIRWLADPANQLRARSMMEHRWDITGEDDDDATDLDVEQLLTKTKEDISTKGTSTIRAKRWVPLFMRSAASWLVMILGTAVLLFFLYKELGWRARLTMTTAELSEVESATGQITMKVLPDGTRVWLNTQSKLKYPPEFGATREVELQGEAFFDVAEDKRHPFIVKAAGINVRVLGTAFNVKSYPGDPAVTTTLVRGKVSIKKERDQQDDRAIELKPNQQALFFHASKEITLTGVDAARYTSWTDGSLVFDDEPVADVFKRLERWYGVLVHVDDGVDTTCKLTARIDKESLKETLELLQSITGIRYRISGNEVFIEGNICSQ